MQNKPHTGKKISASHVSDEGLTFGIYKTLITQ